MNKKFKIGIVISIFLLLITPSLPAMEFNIVKETYENLVKQEFKELSIEKIETIQNNKQLKNTKLSDDALINILENIRDNILSLISKKSVIPNDTLIYIILIIIYLIMDLIFNGIPILIGNIFTFIKTIGNNIITFIKLLLNLSIKVIIFLIDGSINLLLNTIIFLINSTVQLLVKTWQGIGTFIGLILDILRLIYEAIFPVNV
jgi:hypothetical protein